MEAYNIAIKGGQTKEGFIRDSLIQLYSACDAPETIDSVELREVNESTYQFLGCNSDFDIEFTAEIGYDRREQYLDEVREYNADLKKHVTRTVVKERTVTDWRPYSGKSHKNAVSLIDLGDNDTVDYGDLDEDLTEKYGYYSYDRNEVVGYGLVATDAESLAQYDFIEPSPMQFEHALERAASDAKSKVIYELPGDHERNFRPDVTPTNTNFFVYAVKRFKTSFDFHGKTHFLKQFVTEKVPTIYCSAMDSDEEAKMLRAAEEKELASDPVIQTNKKYLTYTSYAVLGFFGIIVLFGIILPMITEMAGMPMFILGIIGAIASYLVGQKVFQKKIDEQTAAIKARYSMQQNDHFRNLQEKKISLLNARLLMMGQEPLNEEELKQFSEDNKHQLDANYNIKA